MIKVFLAHVLLLPGIIGLGLGFSHLLRLDFSGAGRKVNMGEYGLLGTFALVLIGIVINLFYPVASSIRVAAFIVGYLTLWFRRQVLVGSLVRFEILVACIFVIVSVPACYFSWLFTDAGRYYMPIVKWVQLEPVAVGLSNVHAFFGFNHLWFVLQAMLELPFLGLAGSYVLNSLIICCLFFSAWNILTSSEKAWEHSFFSKLNLFVGLTYFILFSSVINIGNGTGSINSGIDRYVFYVLFLNIQILENPEDRVTKVLCLLLSVLVMTLKTNGIILLLLTMTVLCFAFLQRHPYSIKLLFHSILKEFFSLLGLMTSLLTGAWLIRGVLTSGCLLYPQKLSCFNQLSWTASTAQLQFLSALLSSWYSCPSITFDAAYFALRAKALQWVLTFFIQNVLPLMIVGIILYLSGWIFKGEKSVKGPFRIFVLVWILQIASALVLIYLAPNIWYSYTYAVMTGLLIISFSLFQWKTLLLSRKVVGGVFVALLFLVTVRQRYMRNYTGSFLLDWPLMGEHSYRETVSASNIHFYYPLGNGCYDAPVPCSPIPMGDIDMTNIAGRKMFTAKYKGLMRGEFQYPSCNY